MAPITARSFTVPQTASQPTWDYDPDQVYVVPNPATNESMEPWRLHPNNSDPSGLKIEFFLTVRADQVSKKTFEHLKAAGLCKVELTTDQL